MSVQSQCIVIVIVVTVVISYYVLLYSCFNTLVSLVSFVLKSLVIVVKLKSRSITFLFQDLKTHY